MSDTFMYFSLINRERCEAPNGFDHRLYDKKDQIGSGTVYGLLPGESEQERVG